MTKRYDWILFDADDTLFSFDSFVGLKSMFESYKYEFSKDNFNEYQLLNKALWVELQKGNITQMELLHRRFEPWASKLNASRKALDKWAPEVSAKELNNAFLDSMALTSAPLEGTLNLLKAIKGKAKLGIITNGFTRVQQARLRHLGLTEYFEILVISEQVGVAKPNSGIFDCAFSQMGNPHRSRILMVGDTLESDIQGGINSGIDTCWINIHKKPTPESMTPTYEVFSLQELEVLLVGKIEK